MPSFLEWYDSFRHAGGLGRRAAATAALDQAAGEIDQSESVDVICAWCFQNLSADDLLRLSELLASAAEEDGAPEGSPLAAALERHADKFRKPIPGAKDDDRPLALQTPTGGKLPTALNDRERAGVAGDALAERMARVGEVSTHRPAANLVGLPGYYEQYADYGYARRPGRGS